MIYAKDDAIESGLVATGLYASEAILNAARVQQVALLRFNVHPFPVIDAREFSSECNLAFVPFINSPELTAALTPAKLDPIAGVDDG
jgi:hypothetical protein